MINTVESLRGLYVALGGDIAEVANLNTIPQLLEEISTVAQAAATELPAVKAADNGKVLTVVNSKWAKADLPTASSEKLGGVKVGSGLAIADGVLSASGGLPAVTSSDSGKLLAVNPLGEWDLSKYTQSVGYIAISGTTAGGNVQITWPTDMNQQQVVDALTYETKPIRVNCTTLPNDAMASVNCEFYGIYDYGHFVFKGLYSYTSGSDTLWNEVTVIIHTYGTATADVYVKAFTPTDS